MFARYTKSVDVRIDSGGHFVGHQLTSTAPFIQDAIRRDGVSRRL